MLQYLIVCPLVFLAGLVDSIAGGGGLISLPAFFFAGLPAHVAIGTNKLSSTLGTSVSTARYFKQGFVPVKMAVCSSAAALCGSLIGANLSLLISESVIRHMMIVVLPVVAFYVLKNKDFGESRQTGTLKKEVQLLISMGAGFVIGIYDGLYGPGTGTFLIIAFTVFAHLNIQTANAQAKVINLTTNLTALAIFLYNGQGVLSLGLASAACNMLGGYIGAGLVMKNGSKIARPSIVFVLFLLALKALGVY